MISTSQYQHDRNRASCVTHLSIQSRLTTVREREDQKEMSFKSERNEILEINHLRSLSQRISFKSFPTLHLLHLPSLFPSFSIPVHTKPFYTQVSQGHWVTYLLTHLLFRSHQHVVFCYPLNFFSCFQKHPH